MEDFLSDVNGEGKKELHTNENICRVNKKEERENINWLVIRKDISKRSLVLKIENGGEWKTNTLAKIVIWCSSKELSMRE